VTGAPRMSNSLFANFQRSCECSNSVKTLIYLEFPRLSQGTELIGTSWNPTSLAWD
jgi:hypothetical protein